jgi:hypothetical protein
VPMLGAKGQIELAADDVVASQTRPLNALAHRRCGRSLRICGRPGIADAHFVLLDGKGEGVFV